MFGSTNQLVEEEPLKNARKKDGLSLLMTVIFIVAEISGTGMMAFPRAFADSGFLGIAILVWYTFNAAYTGVLMGRSWMILEERWPQYKRSLGNPYPTIGERAVGSWIKIPVSIISHITLLGGDIVFVLLISKFMQQMLGWSFCWWVIVLIVILLPFTFFGAPHDFWPIAVLALMSTVVACILALVVMFGDFSVTTLHVPKLEPTSFNDFFLALSTFSFSFGGASAFPTFQNDMKKRNLFQKAVVIAFGIVLVMMLTMGVSGYVVYGDRNTANILETLPPGVMRTVAQCLMVGHLFTAFVIIFNTPCQEYEQMLGVPRRFTWKRVAVRTSVMAIVAFVCLSIPDFGKILNLVGAIAANTTTFVLPAIFYFFLCTQHSPGWPDRRVSLPTKIYLWIIVLIGVVSGIIGTYASLSAILDPKAFSLPCYLAAFMGKS